MADLTKMSDGELEQHIGTLKSDDPQWSQAKHLADQRKARRITESGGMRAAKLKVLRAIAASMTPLDFDEYSHEFSFVAVRELHDAQMIAGAPCYLAVAAESHFLNAELTYRGREYMEDLERTAPQNTADPSSGKPASRNEEIEPWYKRPLGLIWVTVAGSVLATAATYAINHYWSRTVQ